MGVQRGPWILVSFWDIKKIWPITPGKSSLLFLVFFAFYIYLFFGRAGKAMETTRFGVSLVLRLARVSPAFYSNINEVLIKFLLGKEFCFYSNLNCEF